jgi:hypothetical protein
MSRIAVDVQIDIAAEPTDVAGVMFDPNREPEWMTAVTAVELVDPGIRPGARVRHTGHVMGRELSWTTAVAGFHFPHLLELRVDDGPVQGTVTYHVVRSGRGSTARITSVGSAVSGFLPEAMNDASVRAALGADLERLKELVERETAAAEG